MTLRYHAVARLYVHRSPFAPTTRAPWRLVWANPGATHFCYAEGECSARYFETMRAAIVHGQRQYDETATRWVWGHEFPAAA